MKLDNTKFRLTSDQYYPEKTTKNLIVLHHTVGGSAKSTFDYWQSTPDHIATAYIVERDGTVYETFDPDCWAHHVGSKDSRNVALNKRSIGIEIASEGALIKNKDTLYCFGVISQRTTWNKPFVDLGKVWRSYQYFDPYDEPQLAAVIELVQHLKEKYHIQNRFPNNIIPNLSNYNYDPKYLDHVGICGHAHLRPDKSDVHPLFPWDKLL